MRIERTNQMSDFLKCLPFEREVRKKGREKNRESDMLMMIESMLLNPLFGLWIAYDDNGNISGYVCAVLNPMPGSKKLFLLRIYAKQKELFDQFENILMEWAKKYKVKVCSMTVTSNVKAFQRKYGFTPVSINMEKVYFK